MSCCEIFIFNFFPIPLFSMMKIVAGKLRINGPQAFLKLTSKGEREREGGGSIVQLCWPAKPLSPSREGGKGKVHCSFPFLMSQRAMVLKGTTLHFISTNQRGLKTTSQQIPIFTKFTYIAHSPYQPRNTTIQIEETITVYQKEKNGKERKHI